MSTTTRSRLKSSSAKKSSIMPTAGQSATELEKTRQEAVAMKSRIRSLELEVETLKRRLDSLRKAKNTTIIKREREEIHIQPPNLGRFTATPLQPATVKDIVSCTLSRNCLLSSSQTGLEEKHQLLQEQLLLADNQLKECRETISRLSSDNAESNYRLQQLQEEHKQIVKGLTEKQSEIELTLQKEREKSREINVHIECVAATEEREDLLKELERMRSENTKLASQLSDLVDANIQLRESNQLLQGKCETLLEDLSVKEAQWSEREERLQSEIRKQWGERYHEWITKAESKMEELQKVNAMLQTLLRTKAHNPDL